MELPPDTVLVWTFSVPDQICISDSLIGVLSDPERERAARFHFVEDRARYIFFHTTLRQLLASVLPGLPGAQELRFGLGEYGKPSLVDWPGVHFNLSHSNDQAALAVTLAGPVGIDVEMLDSEFPAREIAREYFVGEERAAIDQAATESERTRRFFQLWTAKEAVMKVTGFGMTLEPRSIELALDSRTACPVGFHQVTGFPHAAEDWKLHTMGLGDSAMLSLVYPASVGRVEML